MLKLRQAIVVEVRSPGDGVSVVELDVEVDGQRRRASADTHLVGACEVGDSVVVNIEAVELALGSGGRDIVLLNLSRGLDEPVAGGDHVMKLNYTPLQHAVAPVEPEELSLPVGGAAAVFQLHAQLPCVVWQAKQH
ncbi:MAG: DUF3866 family protein, partial [Thermoleophilaceae bacterium]|nr:DUF3866 family protein [Thermoleophilaceae bacterium]